MKCIAYVVSICEVRAAVPYRSERMMKIRTRMYARLLPCPGRLLGQHSGTLSHRGHGRRPAEEDHGLRPRHQGSRGDELEQPGVWPGAA